MGRYRMIRLSMHSHQFHDFMPSGAPDKLQKLFIYLFFMKVYPNGINNWVESFPFGYLKCLVPDT